MLPVAKTSDKTRIGIIVLFCICIYLLCTGFLHVTYTGAYIAEKDSKMYTSSQDGISFDAVKYADEEGSAGIILKALDDTDVIHIEVETIIEQDLETDMFLKATLTRDESGVLNLSPDNLSVDAENVKKGDEISLVIKDAKEKSYFYKGEFIYDTNILSVSYVFDTKHYSEMVYSAFDLLFGSQSRENMNFNGNYYALAFWLPPVIGLVLFFFERKSSYKYLAGMMLCVAGILAVITLIGGARLAMGSMLSIVFYLTIFILCVYGLFSKTKDNTAAPNNQSQDENTKTTA